MKRLLALLLVLAMVMAYVPPMIAQAETEITTEFAGGSGTEADPYLISNKYHLDNVRNYLNSNFKLINDIEFTEEDFSEGGDFYNYGVCWKPIGDSTNMFTGKFDGGNFVIKNLQIHKKNSDYVGLFGYIYNGSVSNLHLVNVDIEGKNYVGSVCGYLHSASVANRNNVKSAQIISCYSSGNIVGYGTYTGGLCGYMNGTAYGFGSPNPNLNAYRYADAKIKNSINEADVTGAKYSGGIVGYASSDGCTISSCVNGGAVTATSAAGGILGYSNGEKGQSYSIYGFQDILTYRYYFDYAILENCTNRGNVSASMCGGIIGDAYYTSYGSSGTYNGAINSYNIGTLTGDTVGGIIPCKFTGEIKNCFYLDASASAYSTSYGTSVSTNDLKMIDTFTAWDFDSIWTMAGDTEYPYPELQYFVLYGKPGIDGIVAYNNTVTVNFETLNCKPCDYICTWRVDGAEVATGDEYTIRAEDVGKNLTVVVTSSDALCAGSVVSAKCVVEKAEQTDPPVIPELIDMTDTKFEITTVPTQEYSIDNVNWQSGGVFENLESEKTYTVYTRILETDGYLLGESTEVLKVNLTKACDHEWDVTITKPATYTSMGEQVSTCIYCGEEKAEAIPAKFYGTSVNLGNTLDMYFGFYTGLVDENGTVKFVREFADGTAETTEAPITSFKKNNSVYDITYTGLAAKEMCDTIHIYVYNSEGTLVGEHSDSIRSYILRQLREKDYGAEFRTLCVDLLNYGAAAQVEFEYNEDDLANKDLTAEELAGGTQTVDAYTDKQTIDGDATSYYGTAYILETQISMSMAVRADRIGADCYALVSYTNHMGEEKTNIRLEGKKNYSVYEFFLNEIVVADGRCLLTIEFYKADGTKVLAVQDSMESYTARNAVDYPLAEKMLAFSDSAYKYLHRNDK